MSGLDISVYSRKLLIDLSIPTAHVWTFLEKYAKAFAVADDIYGNTPKPVENYQGDHAFMHVKVSVSERDEGKLYDFLGTFCTERGISFRDPRKVTA